MSAVLEHQKKAVGWLAFNMMKKNQQMGQFKRGNPMIEQMMGSMLQKMMPRLPALPQQNMQGGMGMMGKVALGSGYNKMRLLNTVELKKHLMQYSRYGQKMNKSIDPRKLLRW